MPSEAHTVTLIFSTQLSTTSRGMFTFIPKQSAKSVDPVFDEKALAPLLRAYEPAAAAAITAGVVTFMVGAVSPPVPPAVTKGLSTLNRNLNFFEIGRA